MTFDINARASAVAIETKFQTAGLAGRFLPQRIAVVGQGNTDAVYSADKRQVTSAFEVGGIYGFGSPLYLAIEKLLPANGDGVGSIPVTVYPLVDDVSGVAALGDIIPSGAQLEIAAYRISINNILSAPFVITPGDLVADIVTAMTTAVNSVLGMPVVATDNTTEIILTAKWKGESSNDLKIAVIGSTTAGTVFGITQPKDGAANPDVQSALDKMGSIWETLVLNCLNKTDTVALDRYKDFGEGRWQPIVKKPLIVFSGDVNLTVAAAVAIPEARKTDRVNAQLVSPGSLDLPFVVAARQLARIAVVAKDNPPTGYSGLVADGLTPAADEDEWDYTERDEAIKKGSSTITVENGQVVCGDIVTFYHPDGDPEPAYRYVVNIVKLQNITYNMNLIFTAPEWRASPLVPSLIADNNPTVNPNARSPASARAEIAGLLDFLGSWAFISDPADSKKKTVAQIDEFNPNRLDIKLFIKLSGNTRIIAIIENFSFFFGGA